MSKLGILAGGGELPAVLIQACRQRGWDFHVIAFRGHADPAIVADAAHDWLRLGEAATAIRRLKATGADRLVFCGKVSRPTLGGLMPDWRALAFLGRIGGRLLSDNNLLSAIVAELESEGFAVIGPADVDPSLLARRGPYGRLIPTAEEERSIALGFAAAKGIGSRDIGQAAVVRNEIVVDVEGPDGTDALMERCARRQGKAAGAILIKARKPQQEMRADPPVIGLGTLKVAKVAGFRGIAVEAGGVLVLNVAALGSAADEAGMFVVGVEHRA